MAGKVPGRREYPTLVITLPESPAEAFNRMYGDFVAKGNKSSEKNRELQFLVTTLRDILFFLKFQNPGIIKLTTEGGGSIKSTDAVMTIECVEFSHHGFELMGP